MTALSDPAGKLSAFLRDKGIPQAQAARDLGVSAPTVLDWCRARKVPDTNNRRAIARYTKGEILEPEWETEQEREQRIRAEHVEPFQPIPEEAADAG